MRLLEQFKNHAQAGFVLKQDRHVAPPTPPPTPPPPRADQIRENKKEKH